MTQHLHFPTNRFQNRRMKHKKDTSNVKSVNKPPKSIQLDSHKSSKDSKSPDDCHQDIVKRLMTHSQYFPANPNNKPVSVSYSKSATSNVIRHYPPSYSSHMNSNNQQLTVDNNYSKDYYYQQQQQECQQQAQGFDQYSTSFNTCLSPSLMSPTNYHNFDQLSYIDGSPRNDYIFNGEFISNFNTDFDGSFPLLSAGAAAEEKTPQLMDNQASEMILERYTDIASAAQLTPLTIESQPNGCEIKNSFDDVKNNNVLVNLNLSDDDVLSNASYISRSPPSATVDWKFTE